MVPEASSGALSGKENSFSRHSMSLNGILSFVSGAAITKDIILTCPSIYSNENEEDSHTTAEEGGQ
jgi:hypothetical protein